MATLKWGRQTFGNVLYRKVLAGNYEVDFVEPVETEKCLGNKNDRIDIWMDGVHESERVTGTNTESASRPDWDSTHAT